MPHSRDDGSADRALVPLTLHLPESMIDWLSDHAERRDVSVDRLVCRLLTVAGPPDAPGPQSPSGEASAGREAPGASSSDEADEDTVLCRLRRAREKLEGLRGEEAAGTSGTESEGEERSDADDGPPSMFEMVEGE